MKSVAALALALPLAAYASPLNARAGTNGGNSLDALAQAAGKKYFGTEISSYYLANKQFSKILDQEFNQITPENEMKWEVIEPQRGVFNWTGSDLVSQQCSAL